MGIGRAVTTLLAQETARRSFEGSILTLGRQDIIATPQELTERLNSPVASPIDDGAYFRLLGFSEVESMDFSDYEHATHIHDLNYPVPESMAGRYDVVMDSGTIEHVFNVPQALKNAVDMVKVGGRLIILSPSSNYFEHGFYMFCPTLFLDYLTANKLIIETFYILRASPDAADKYDVYRYDGSGDFFVGCLDNRPYLIYLVATKTADSTSDQIPQQGAYLRTWARPEAPARGTPSTLHRLAKGLLGRIPGGMRLAYRLRGMVKPQGVKSLPRVGAY